MDSSRTLRRVLTALGLFSVGYSVVVLAFVATSPDLGLRFLVSNESPDGKRGVQVQAIQGMHCSGPVQPAPGDFVVALRRLPMRTFFDFTSELHHLNNVPVPDGGYLDQWVTDPSKVSTSLPPLVQLADGRRMVELQFRKPNADQVHVAWLELRSQPFAEVILTLVYFLLELAIVGVAALAFWMRPFDQSARLFFSMCIVAIGAFVAGFHWWVISGSILLNVPFIVLATLVPPVTLHFFLVFPHPKPVLHERPLPTLVAVYAIPAVATVALVAMVLAANLLSHHPDSSGAAPILSALLFTIYGYLLVSGLYFLLTLVALIYSFFTTRNQIEHHQVKWILWAGLLATLPLGYTLYLAYADRAGFALGRGRWPMFLASLSFMFAYAVGILRHKLFLGEQLLGRGGLNYLARFGITVLFAVAVAFGAAFPRLLTITLTQTQQFALFAILLTAVVLLFWLRDRAQQLIDRRFFREKYQLDKALQRMNRAAGHLLNRESIAGLMLGSCREVLHVGRAAIYMRNSPRNPFQLMAVEGSDEIPYQLRGDDEDFVKELEQAGSLQRVTLSSRERMSPAQKLLHDLGFDLIHALHVDDQLAGLVILGGKRNAASFTAEDLTYLNAMAQITIVALHNAKVNQDITRLNEDLQMKVERIAEQRRQIEMLQAELTNAQTVATPRPANEATTDETERAFERDHFKGDSPAIRRVLRTVEKVARTESSVLIRGESGTGKEVLAEVLHNNSERRNGPMIRVHCAALSPSLLESELFGHTKGAFTGAHRDRIGRFEAANGGTLFLDEIGDISLETQVKLLRVLQDRCFEPVGGTRTIHVDVRLITATHQNLEQLITSGRFREDLFYRLNVISITLPPLRERREDLIELALFFLNRSADRVGKRITHIDDDALGLLQRYSWPGNIRELENVIERAVVLAEDERISVSDLPAYILETAVSQHRKAGHTEISESARAKPRSAPRTTEPTPRTFRIRDDIPLGRVSELENDAAGIGTVKELERQTLVTALREADGNKARAARALGLPRSTYYSKLKRYGIE